MSSQDEMPPWHHAAKALSELPLERIGELDVAEWSGLCDLDFDAFVRECAPRHALRLVALWRHVMERVAGNPELHHYVLQVVAVNLPQVHALTLPVLLAAPLEMRMKVARWLNPIEESKSDEPPPSLQPSMELMLSCVFELEPADAREFFDEAMEQFELVDTITRYRVLYGLLQTRVSEARAPLILMMLSRVEEWLEAEGYLVGRVIDGVHGLTGQPQLQVVIGGVTYYRLHHGRQEGRQRRWDRYRPIVGETVLVDLSHAKNSATNVFAALFLPILMPPPGWWEQPHHAHVANSPKRRPNGGRQRRT